MEQGDNFDWRPHSERFWRECAEAAGVNANPQQLKFAAARQRGLNQGEAAEAAGYIADRNGDFRKAGSKAASSPKVRAILAAADEAVGGSLTDMEPLDDRDIEKILGRKALTGNLGAIAELRRRRRPERDGLDADVDLEDLLLRIAGAGSHAGLYGAPCAIFLWLGCGRSLLDMPGLPVVAEKCPSWLWEHLVKEMSPASRAVLDERLENHRSNGRYDAAEPSTEAGAAA